MSPLVAATVAAALAGLGLLLVVRGLVGSTTPLAGLVADLHRPRTTTAPADGVRAGVLRVVAGRPSRRRDADLAVCGRDAAWWVQQSLAWTLLGAAPGLALALVVLAGGLQAVLPAAALAAVPVGAGGGWGYARVDLAGDADRARRAFRHALASYLELVTILLAGGAGVETAMFDAADVGRGPAFGHIRAALAAAQARRDPPWHALGQLGGRLGVGELEELEAAMTLAGAGAQVRDSLTAKATAIRLKDVAQVESEAQARSETMVLPVVLMFAGFLLMIGYPALAALSNP
jgi:Flp pilus assembly protein TadB